MECLFCAIATGRTPADIVLEESHAVAFLDTRPLFPGHTLVVPLPHAETLEDLDPDLVDPYFSAVQRVTRAVREATASQGTFVAVNNVVSQSVAHLHTHVVPRNRGDGLRGFFWPRNQYESATQRLDITEAIRRRLAVS